MSALCQKRTPSTHDKRGCFRLEALVSVVLPLPVATGIYISKLLSMILGAKSCVSLISKIAYEVANYV